VSGTELLSTGVVPPTIATWTGWRRASRLCFRRLLAAIEFNAPTQVGFFGCRQVSAKVFLKVPLRHSRVGLRHPAIAFSPPPEQGALERLLLPAELRTECDQSRPEPDRPIQMRVHLPARSAETCRWILRSGETADRRKQSLERISSSKVLYLLSERQSKNWTAEVALL